MQVVCDSIAISKYPLVITSYSIHYTKLYDETLLTGALSDAPAAERFLAIVARQATRLEAIIDDLLALSRIEQSAGQEAIPLRRGAIRPVLLAAQQVCQPAAVEKNLKLRLFCSDELQGKINAPLLEQAVVNLLTNAIKYSPTDATRITSYNVCYTKLLRDRERRSGRSPAPLCQ